MEQTLAETVFYVVFPIAGVIAVAGCLIYMGVQGKL